MLRGQVCSLCLPVCNCVYLCVCVSCPLWTVPRPWPQCHKGINLLPPDTMRLRCPLKAPPDWLLPLARGPVDCSWPPPLTTHPPPSFKSHCFLRPLSLFLYHRLIHPATRALSGPVSRPAGFRDESGNTREGGRDREEHQTITVIACAACSSILSPLPGEGNEPRAFISKRVRSRSLLCKKMLY